MAEEARTQPSKAAQVVSLGVFGLLVIGLMFVAVGLDSEGGSLKVAAVGSSTCANGLHEGGGATWTALVIEETADVIEVREVIEWTPRPRVSETRLAIRRAMPGEEALSGEVVDLAVECRNGELWLRSARVIDPD